MDALLYINYVLEIVVLSFSYKETNPAGPNLATPIEFIYVD